MYNCPVCGAEDAGGRTTCRCGADLSLLQRLDALADAWFNQALAALAMDAPGRALEWLSASCVARPTDAAALRALAKLWAQLGRLAEAREALERAAAIEPDDPDVALIRQALTEAQPPGIAASAASPDAGTATTSGSLVEEAVLKPKRPRPGRMRRRRPRR